MQKLTSLFPGRLLGARRRIPAPKGPFLGRLDLSAGKTSVVSAGKTSVVSADTTHVLPADNPGFLCKDQKSCNPNLGIWVRKKWNLSMGSWILL